LNISISCEIGLLAQCKARFIAYKAVFSVVYSAAFYDVDGGAPLNPPTKATANFK